MIENFKRVYELEEQITSNEENIFSLMYDDVSSSKKERSFMLYQSPLYCGGLSSFNNGEYDKLFNQDQNKRRLELAYPQNMGPKVYQTYQPESSEKVLIDNKQVPIKELVAAYENYINSIPTFYETNVKTQVVSASTYQVPNSNNYCVGFTTTANYKGILFDYTKDGVTPEGYQFHLGLGCMVRPDKVDSAYIIDKSYNITDEKEYDKMVSAENALEKVSDELTGEVVFDLQIVCLVYSVTTPPSYEREKDIKKCVAEWKFTLYNKNDNQNYYCYVNACDGKGFHYYSAPAPETD